MIYRIINIHQQQLMPVNNIKFSVKYVFTLRIYIFIINSVSYFKLEILRQHDSLSLRFNIRFRISNLIQRKFRYCISSSSRLKRHQTWWHASKLITARSFGLMVTFQVSMGINRNALLESIIIIRLNELERLDGTFHASISDWYRYRVWRRWHWLLDVRFNN